MLLTSTHLGLELVDRCSHILAVLGSLNAAGVRGQEATPALASGTLREVMIDRAALLSKAGFILVGRNVAEPGSRHTYFNPDDKGTIVIVVEPSECMAASIYRPPAHVGLRILGPPSLRTQKDAAAAGLWPGTLPLKREIMSACLPAAGPVPYRSRARAYPARQYITIQQAIRCTE